MSALATGLTGVVAATGGAAVEFWVFAVMAVTATVSALAMVFSKDAVHGALLLVVNFFALAVLYLLLQAQFVFVVQITVYAGAIMVLFLFVLMLLGVDKRENLRENLRGQRVTAAVLGVVLLAGVVTAISSGTLPGRFASMDAANTGGNVQALGRQLYTRYTLAFEATGVLLLVAGVGALVLARPDTRPGRRRLREAVPYRRPRPDGDDATTTVPAAPREDAKEPVGAGVGANGTADAAAPVTSESAAAPATTPATPEVAAAAPATSATGTSSSKEGLPA